VLLRRAEHRLHGDAGTGDQLKIANSGAGTGVDYTIEIVGY
jgi:hypothetical protein